MNFIKTIKALTVALESELDIPVIHKDIQKGFDRPCLFVDIAKLTTDVQYGIEHEVQEYNILYFGKSRDGGYLDLLKRKQEIQDVLQSEIVTDDGETLDIGTIEWKFDRVDMFLTARFQIETTGGYDIEDDEEMMDTLEINEGVM